MKNPFKALSFQFMFFSTFILFSGLLIVLLGATSHYIINEEVVGQTIRSQSQLLDKINRQLETQMQEIEYDSLVIGSNPKLISFLGFEESSYERIQRNAEMLDLLSRPSYVKTGIHSIQLYSTKNTGSQQININGVFSYRLLTEQPWYKKLAKADYGWIGVHELDLGGGAGGDSVVSFARKVLSSTGKELGLLVINVKLSFLQETIATPNDGLNRMVLDEQYNLVTAEVMDGTTLNQYKRIQAKIKNVLQGSPHTYAVTKLDQKQLLVWDKQQSTHWLVLDEIPWNQVTKGSRRIQGIIVIAGILCFLLSVALAFVLSRQFAKPLKSLIHTMSQIKLGKLHEQVKNNYTNEFGNLYDHFNHMIHRIKQLLDEVNEQHQKKREAEMQTLQSHINPHFIYNTLDIINWRAISQRSHDISHMLKLLGQMLRIGLSGGTMFIPIKKEVEHVGCYIELQKIHYKQLVEFEFAIPETIQHYYIPKIILQPFIENALIHGFNGINQGKVIIEGRETEQEIHFTIRDNGKGFAASSVSLRQTMNEDSGGIGIQNVRDRIQLYYGYAYGVEIDSEPGSGTTVTIRLPKRTAAEEMKGAHVHHDSEGQSHHHR